MTMITGETWYDPDSGQTFTFNSTIVVLANDGYDASEEDPIEGSEHECEGLVLGLNEHDEHCLRVEWDNGHRNDYRPSDVRIIGQHDTMSSDNPNRTYKLKLRGDAIQIREAKIMADQERHERAEDAFDKLKKVMNATSANVERAKKVLHSYIDAGHADPVSAAIHCIKMQDLETAPVVDCDEYAVGNAENFLTTSDTADFKLPDRDIVVDLKTGVRSEVEKIRKIVDTIPLNVVEAKKALTKHGGDVDAVITYHNLNNLPTSEDQHPPKLNPASEVIMTIGQRLLNSGKSKPVDEGTEVHSKFEEMIEEEEVTSMVKSHDELLEHMNSNTGPIHDLLRGKPILRGGPRKGRP